LIASSSTSPGRSFSRPAAVFAAIKPSTESHPQRKAVEVDRLGGRIDLREGAHALHEREQIDLAGGRDERQHFARHQGLRVDERHVGREAARARRKPGQCARDAARVVARALVSEVEVHRHVGGTVQPKRHAADHDEARFAGDERAEDLTQLDHGLCFARISSSHSTDARVASVFFNRCSGVRRKFSYTSVKSMP
jgi:hypothetical protein